MNKRESQYIEELNTGWDGGLGDNDVLRAVQEERDEYRRQRDEIVFKYMDLLEQCLYGGRIDENI